MLEEPPILAASHYYFGVCSNCQNPPGSGSSLKRCSRCQSTFYCSSACQKLHWKKHKAICNYLSSAARAGGLDNFFSGHAGKSREEWNMFRMNAVKTCSVILSRPLELWEQEMFLFPRVCRTPGCFSPGGAGARLEECGGCLVTVWCSHQCRGEARDQHRAVCRQLRLARIADRYESLVRVGIPSLPSNLDNKYYGTAPDITHFLEVPLTDSPEISNLELEFAFLTNLLTGPLTLLDVGHRFVSDFGTREELTVHIAGANVYEVMGIIKWEYLAHRLPQLRSLNLVFIGPDLEEEEGGGGEVMVGQCLDCTDLARHITHQMYNTNYSEFRKLSSSQPDIVLVQNCGYHEYGLASAEWREGWGAGRGLASLLHPGAVLAFTSYTKTEAEADLERFTSQCQQEVEILTSCEQNKMRSHRPIRDWEMDQENDMRYEAAMDLSKLPVTMNNIRRSEKEAITKDREMWWETFYSKYEKLSELNDETLGVEELDDPRRDEIEDDLGLKGYRLQPIASKTFQNFVHQHEDEIDELTTMAGPPGEDEEEIVESDEEVTEYEMEETDGDSEDSSGEPEKISRNLFCVSDDDDSEVESAVPRSFSTLFLSPARSKPNASFREKFLSPKVTPIKNISLMEGSKNNSSLVCETCTVETDYSRDMGIDETDFKCDNCLLSVHPNCEGECQVCRDIASQVDTRRSLRMKFEEMEQSDL